MQKGLSRRRLLQLLSLAAGKVGLGMLTGCDSSVGRAEDGLEPRAYLPLIQSTGATPTPTPTNTPTLTPTGSAVIPTQTSTPTPTPTSTPTPTPTATPTPQTPIPPPAGARVVHVHSEDATSWSGQTDYWNYVNQATVDNMVDQGLMTLTGMTSVAAAWGSLLPGYQSGQVIAIKVNFNNTYNSSTCGSSDGEIDGLIQPVNALVGSLMQAGVAEADIWIYDASRNLPDHFVNGSIWSNVQFFDRSCRIPVTWSSSDPSAFVNFVPPAGIPVPPATRISDILLDASYLINMPIMKPHGIAGVTLTFKNHFGNIKSPQNLHPYIEEGNAYYRTDYNPLIDIYMNPNVGAKTVLIVGDALFAAKEFNVAPAPWSTFGNETPQSLFLATDPVAIDCVMCDFLEAEVGLPDYADDYLVLAAAAGLGVFERGDPWNSGYTVIDYLKVNL